MINSKAIRPAILAAAISVAIGCQSQTMVNHSEEFAPEDQPTAFSRQAAAQAARGASADATLYLCHFDGANLNSLGAAKLDLMLREAGAGSMAVWMAVPDDDKSAMRRMSVAAYLKDHGLPPEQIAFGRGANPQADNPAAQGLKDLPKADTSGGASSSGGSSSVGGAAAGGSAPATP